MELFMSVSVSDCRTIKIKVGEKHKLRSILQKMLCLKSEYTSISSALVN